MPLDDFFNAMQRMIDNLADGVTPDVKIICAAIMDADGLIYAKPRPARHHDCFFRGCEAQKVTCGFLTSAGQFVDRREAYKIAKAAGQILPTALKHHAPLLFSEDVW